MSAAPSNTIPTSTGINSPVSGTPTIIWQQTPTVEMLNQEVSRLTGLLADIEDLATYIADDKAFRRLTLKTAQHRQGAIQMSYAVTFSTQETGKTRIIKNWKKKFRQSRRQASSKASRHPRRAS